MEYNRANREMLAEIVVNEMSADECYHMAMELLERQYVLSLDLFDEDCYEYRDAIEEVTQDD